MKILVTGAKGFVGKNLIAELKNRDYKDIIKYTRETDEFLLDEYTKNCDFVFHLAGVNRPKEEKEFMEGNYDFTSKLLTSLKKNKNKAPVLMTSSIQAKENNPYGKSKKAGEDLLFNYSKETGVKVYVYRLPNLFGKWSKPNYNSVIATFCHNIARDLEIEIHDPEVELSLAYIDDVVEELINALEGKPTKEGKFCIVSVVHRVKLSKITELIKSFKESKKDLSIPDLSEPFTKKLHSTYLSYLPE